MTGSSMLVLLLAMFKLLVVVTQLEVHALRLVFPREAHSVQYQVAQLVLQWETLSVQ
jgi:hypothetical protein